MKFKKRSLSTLAILLSLSTFSATSFAEDDDGEISFTEEVTQADWDCSISDDTFELRYYDSSTDIYQHIISDRGKVVCESNEFSSECNNAIFSTPYYFYKKGRMIDNANGNRLYRLCRLDSLSVKSGRDDKLEEIEEYEARGGKRW